MNSNADIMTLEDFYVYCKWGSFSNYDGSGYYGDATHELSPRERVDCTDSPIKHSIATHVHWYNK